VRPSGFAVAAVFALCACGDDGGSDTAAASTAAPSAGTETTGTPSTEPTQIEPPEDFAALDALFGPALEEVGLDLTRASVAQFETGPHIALYGVPAADADADADYLARLLPSTVASGAIAFDRFPGVASFDICQEPTGTSSEAPPPVTIVVLTRDQWESVPDWGEAQLVDLLAAATTGNGGHVEVSDDVRELEAFEAAVAQLDERRG
jgi:hypothetical protein